ncbi:BTAD domain-containing putative transcriptional regulator [Streptomyces sp. NPDC048416]|uniref:AfsR/SARP family transcriptional regulator n=1 Tax=Streptomyces sp. NPDC048416 TaxID=3365546 RepID=UPI0037109039
MTITAPLRGNVLGPVEASWCTTPIALGGPRRRALFAALVLHAGQVMSVDRLVSLVWGADPPSSAVTKLHGQVSGLRAAIDAVAGSGSGRNVVLTRSPGYLVPTEVVSTDIEEFEALLTSVQSLSPRPAEAAARYENALALWRGRVAEDVLCHEPWPVVVALEARRWQTVESRARADLAAGNAETVVDTLAKEMESAPYRETLIICYVRALYQCGRQVDALDVLRAAHERLRVELGLDPSPELQRLEAEILRHDPSLVGSTNGPKIPSSLPPGPRALFGRDAELGALLRICDIPAPHAVVAAVSGLAGIGKTALALAAAHQLRPHYPDGSLYFDLRGNERKQLPPARAMVRTLRSLGLDDLSIPGHPEEILDLYRTTLADRRILLVLDNAGSEAQVRPLIPVSNRCAALITSRKRLSGLTPSVAFSLTPLAPSAALSQFSGLVGARRVAAEPERTDVILRRCGYHPLAVHIAGARLATRPHWSIGELADRLEGGPNSIDELAVGNVCIRTFLEESYRSLSLEIRRAFSALMSLPTIEYQPGMLANLFDTSRAAATDLLDTLVDHGLMEVSGLGNAGAHCYRANELVRAFMTDFAAKVCYPPPNTNSARFSECHNQAIVRPQK